MLAGCGGDGRERAAAGPSDWPQPNGTLSSTRAVRGPDASAPSGLLRVRWRFRLRGEPGFSGIFASTPVVSAGRVYLQDLNSDVYALSLADGHVLWRHRYGRPNGGPNGVAISNGVIYGNTDTSAFALSADTGVERWRRRLTERANPITTAPLVANGLVYTSSTGQAPGGRGMLFALDADTGALRWRFDTIVGKWRYPPEASGGGAWYPPSVDADVSLCLYRIAQESLHNVVRHSHARDAHVTIGCDDGFVSLQIADSGIGFDPRHAAHAGLGLHSMRERVAILNGQLTIDAAQGSGTHIMVRIPLGSPAQHAGSRQNGSSGASS